MEKHSDYICDNNCPKISELDEQYRNLISKISHEIRNPLTLICSSLQLIEKEYPEVKVSFLWPQIRQDLQDTIHLLQNISSLNGSNRLTMSSIRIDHFLNNIASSFASFISERQIKLIVEIAPALSDLEITADAGKLKEAISNLILNAADAVNTASTPYTHTENLSTEALFSGEIMLIARQEEHDLAIHVTDNGPGIPPEYLATLFDPFVTHKANGTGLGLSIVQSIAAQHGGSLSVNTSTIPETFTDFCLKLPMK